MTALITKIFSGLFSKRMVGSLVRHLLSAIGVGLALLFGYFGADINPEQLAALKDALQPILNEIITLLVGAAIAWSAYDKAK